MADVEKLFREYVAEHRAGGEANPRVYLEQASGLDREELATLIDGYLVRSPGQAWDRAGFEGSASELWVEGMERSMGGRAGLWPVLLPRLRERAQIKRAELVERLAAVLGVGGQTEKVAAYYHQMEYGQLDSKGVTTRVLEALAGIVGSSAEALRSAGEPFGAGQAPSEGTVFARTAGPTPAKFAEPPVGKASPGLETAADEAKGVADRAPSQPGGSPDEVDRLFTGGD